VLLELLHHHLDYSMPELNDENVSIFFFYISRSAEHGERFERERRTAGVSNAEWPKDLPHRTT
jgi:hypothetical protein